MKYFKCVTVPIFCILIGLIIDGCESKKSSDDDTGIDMSDPKVVAMRDSIMASLWADVAGREWKFSFEKDEMTDETNIFAKIISQNKIEQDFPYGSTFSTITVRYMKKYGGFDVLVSVSEGQIYGKDYLLVRFDEDEPIKYWYSKPTSGSSDVVFISRTTDFIEHCKKAKSIRIEIPLFNCGNPIFKFEVDEPLVWREKES